jgi:hypothetical protein
MKYGCEVLGLVNGKGEGVDRNWKAGVLRGKVI